MTAVLPVPILLIPPNPLMTPEYVWLLLLLPTLSVTALPAVSVSARPTEPVSPPRT